MVKLGPPYTAPPHEANRARMVILEIARQSPGGVILGKTKLFKAFYFAHLFYASSSPGYLTEWPIVRMPNGPGIDQFELLVSGLVDDKALVCDPVKVGPYQTTQFRVIGMIQTDNPLSKEEIQAIRQAVEFTRDKTAEQLSEITHEYSRSWNESAEMGRELNIYKDLLADEAREGLEEMATQVSDEVDEVFGG